MTAAMAAAHTHTSNKIEKRNETAYFTFGRFQPPTLGHGALLRKIESDAARDDADAYVFVSSTVDTKSNPLSVDTKVRLMKSMFADLKIRIINTTECECTHINSILYKLTEAGYSKIVMYVGEDRVEGFRSFLPDTVEIREAAKRNTLSTRISGISGTKMRAAALANNIDLFREGTGLNAATARSVMENIKTGFVSKAVTKKRRRGSRKHPK